jgi:hypothetical protein
MREEQQKRPLLKRLQEAIRRLLGKKPSPSSPPPGDPYAYVMAPVRRGPKGRSGAAVAEIEEDSYRSFPPRRS